MCLLAFVYLLKAKRKLPLKRFQLCRFPFLGNRVSGSSQFSLSMGAEGWKGEVRVCFVGRSSGNCYNLGDAGRDHRELGVAIRLLHSSSHDIRPCSDMVHSCRWLTSWTSENIERRERLHSRIARRHCFQGKDFPSDFPHSHLDSLPGLDDTSLWITLGTLLPANCCTNVHDRSIELQFIESRIFVVAATSRSSSCWLWIRSHWRLHQTKEFNQSYDDKKIFLSVL